MAESPLWRYAREHSLVRQAGALVQGGLIRELLQDEISDISPRNLFASKGGDGVALF